MSTPETSDEKINRVAKEINDILVRERMMMTPTIELRVVPEESAIITPGDIRDIITP